MSTRWRPVTSRDDVKSGVAALVNAPPGSSGLGSSSSTFTPCGRARDAPAFPITSSGVARSRSSLDGRAPRGLAARRLQQVRITRCGRYCATCLQRLSGVAFVRGFPHLVHDLPGALSVHQDALGKVLPMPIDSRPADLEHGGYFGKVSPAIVMTLTPASFSVPQMEHG